MRVHPQRGRAAISIAGNIVSHAMRPRNAAPSRAAPSRVVHRTATLRWLTHPRVHPDPEEERAREMVPPDLYIPPLLPIYAANKNTLLPISFPFRRIGGVPFNRILR